MYSTIEDPIHDKNSYSTIEDPIGNNQRLDFALAPPLAAMAATALPAGSPSGHSDGNRPALDRSDPPPIPAPFAWFTSTPRLLPEPLGQQQPDLPLKSATTSLRNRTRGAGPRRPPLPSTSAAGSLASTASATAAAGRLKQSWFSESLLLEPATLLAGDTTPAMLARQLTLMEDERASQQLLQVWPGGGGGGGPDASIIPPTADAAQQPPGDWLYRYPSRLLAAGAQLARAAEEQRRRQVWFMRVLAEDAARIERHHRASADRWLAAAAAAGPNPYSRVSGTSGRPQPLSEQQVMEGQVRQVASSKPVSEKPKLLPRS